MPAEATEIEYDACTPQVAEEPKSRSWYAVRALRNGRTRARNHITNGDLIAANQAQDRAAHTAEMWLTGRHASDDITKEGQKVLQRRQKKLVKRSR